MLNVTQLMIGDLTPFVEYTVQVRARFNSSAYWSDWSANVTQRTSASSESNYLAPYNHKTCENIK